MKIEIAKSSDIQDLCNFLESLFAQEKGCKRMTLLTDHNNEGAHRFYKKHGFDTSTMVVFRKLL